MHVHIETACTQLVKHNVPGTRDCVSFIKICSLVYT